MLNIDSRQGGAETVPMLGRHELLLMCILFYLFFSYPFFLRNINVTLYAVVLNLALIFLVIVIVRSPRAVILYGILDIKASAWLTGFLACYVVYFLILNVASIFRFDQPDIVRTILVRWRDLLLVSALFLLLNSRVIEKGTRIYVDLLVVLSVLGLLLVSLKFFFGVTPIGTVQLESVGQYDSGIREFYGIGFIWPDIWIGSVVGLPRLQSFSDEAGTFAFALLPAIVLAAYWRQRWKTGILFLCLIFTFSIGAYLTIFAIWISYLTVQKKWSYLLGVLIGIGVLAMLFYALTNQRFVEVISNYVGSKSLSFSSDRTSGGQRIEEGIALIKFVAEAPWGWGAGSLALDLKLAVAVGWLIPMLESGVAGWLFFVLAFAILIVQACRAAIVSTGLESALGTIIVILAIQGLQRAGLGDTIWHWWWTIAFCRIYASCNSNQVKSA